MDVVPLATALLAGYLLGAIPSGYLVALFLAHRDVRAQGSGKTGATNVRRLLGWRGFFLVLFLDALKGVAAVVLARWLVPEPDTWAAALGGLAAVTGHTWPVFLRFRGGRGVAPGGGAMFAMLPEVMLLSTLVGAPTVLL
nr:glycerol-3-phosphate acyltransferase [Chloroflexia bacterium]